MSGSTLFLLQYVIDRVVRKAGLDLLGLVTDYGDQLFRAQGQGGVQHMRNHRPACNLVQQLDLPGAHPRSHARSQNDGGNRFSGQGHDATPPLESVRSDR